MSFVICRLCSVFVMVLALSMFFMVIVLVV